jgi:hypothetical protein
VVSVVPSFNVIGRLSFVDHPRSVGRRLIAFH